MPAGPGPMGFVYFLGAKLAGYTMFCHWIVNRRVLKAGMLSERNEYRSPLGLSSPSDEAGQQSGRIPSAVKAGVVRTGIGLVVGAAVGLGFWAIPFFSRHDTAGTVLFFSFLVPVRVGEWALLFWWIYRMRPGDALVMRMITFGLLVSFALDAIGVLATMVLPGGMWVC